MVKTFDEQKLKVISLKKTQLSLFAKKNLLHIAMLTRTKKVSVTLHPTVRALQYTLGILPTICRLTEALALYFSKPLSTTVSQSIQRPFRYKNLLCVYNEKQLEFYAVES